MIPAALMEIGSVVGWNFEQAEIRELFAAQCCKI
jgi:hypothetical protein